MITKEAVQEAIRETAEYKGLVETMRKTIETYPLQGYFTFNFSKEMQGLASCIVEDTEKAGYTTEVLHGGDAIFRIRITW